MKAEFVTIELHGSVWKATAWDRELAVLAQGSGTSAQAALQNAMGVLGRRESSSPRHSVSRREQAASTGAR